MIGEIKFAFGSADGVNNIAAKYWLPEEAPKGIIQIVHGMLEYKERYDGFARFMAENGYIVCANDHLGHGDSVSSRSDLGYISEKGSSDLLVEDVNTLRKTASRDYPGLPYIILGHSMGSYILRKYLSKYGEGLAGAIVMGTGQSPAAVTAAGLMAIRFEALRHGWRYHSTAIQKLTFNKSYEKFDLTGKHPENSWLTRDPEIVKAYYRDPKCTFMFTVAAYKALVEMVNFDAKQSNAAKIPKELPILLISGEEDPVGDLGAGVRAVYESYKKAGLENTEIRLYPGARHELLNETNKEEVKKDILAWTDSRIG